MRKDLALTRLIWTSQEDTCQFANRRLNWLLDSNAGLADTLEKL